MSEAVPGGLEAVLAKVESRWRVPGADLQSLDRFAYAPPDPPDDSEHRLHHARKALQPYQRMLYAGKRYSVLLLFQALDAAGKDGVIREVFEGLDPVNVNVSAFKRPTETELQHDFLWRTTQVLPRRGEIAVFNRSYYEEVLAVRVHPGFLEGQYGGTPPDPATLWPARYRAIREHERHLAAARTLILKFWLNVSPAKQAERFLERLDTPEKRWKFSLGDVHESNHRAAYDEAVLAMFQETSRPWAPWFCVPADNSHYLRWQIAEILGQALGALPLAWPEPDEIPPEQAVEARELLELRVDRKPR